MKIMIADDDPGILEALKLMMEYEGFSVTTTLDGNSLLHLSEDLPDLILLDLWMSGTDGVDICRYLKDTEITKKIPVLLISASQDIHNSALKAGADDYLSKPFEINDLLNKINKYLAGPRGSAEY